MTPAPQTRPARSGLADRIDAAEPDPRVRAILWAAYRCFAAQGLRRTAMQDIAAAAGMSRAALYLHFRNKDDIFRAMLAGYFEAASGALAAALDQPGPMPEVFAAGMAVLVDETAAGLLGSAHAGEILSEKHATGRAVVAEGSARLAAVLGDWLARQAAAGGVAPEALGGAPRATAAAILAALDGPRASAADWDAYRAARARLVTVIARGLAP